jgi:hypothetical protein
MRLFIKKSSILPDKAAKSMKVLKKIARFYWKVLPVPVRYNNLWSEL